MEFKDDVSQEVRELLEMELHRYKREMHDITRNEWNLLTAWVSSGHSPYTNPDDVYADDGWPMDFVNTLRFWNNFYEAQN